MKYGSTEIKYDSSPEEFVLYKTKYEEDGYECVFSRASCGNMFATLLKDDVVHLTYSRDTYLRITTDGNTNLPSFEKQEAAPVLQPVYWQFETNHIYIDCGMCIIIRLCDGSFFLVDSAHYLSPGDHERIHNFLRKNTNTERITIAGWYFSHGHTDHLCEFMQFLKAGYDDTDIEGIYYNFVDYATHPDRECWEEQEQTVSKDFMRLVGESGIPVYTPHSGQVFYIRDMQADVLCTHEDVYPLSMADFNDTSTALMLNVSGTRIFVPGDCSRKSSAVLESRWGNALECDVLQVSHHGHTGLTKNLYEMAKGRIALFANTKIKHDEEYPRREENRRIIELAGEFYVSSEGTVEIPLPYKSGNVKIHAPETVENFNAIENLWGYTYTDGFKKNVYDTFLKNGGDSEAIRYDLTENRYVCP